MHKHMLRALGLSLIAALGLMAFSAANALAAGEILVEGSAALATGRTVGGEKDGTVENTLKVPALSIEIVCKDFSVNGTVLSGPAGTALAEVLYKECVVWSIKKETLELIEELKTCEILASGATKTKGDITALGIGGVLLHTGIETYLLAEGETVGGVKQPFAIVEFTKGIGCPLSTPVKVTGSAVFKVVTGNVNVGGDGPQVKPLLEASEAITALLGDKLLYGINPAFIKGAGKVFLTNTDVGLKWGAK
jgi:hypothetical protein